MNITLESDYAVRIVSTLAAHPDTRTDAKTISELTGVTLRFSLKILHKLVQAGIAKSYKGMHGGYALARPGAEITLREVIEAIDGEFLMSRCLGDPALCSNPNNAECRFRKVFSKVSRIMRDELDKVTF